ncbi:WD repeat-containing protein 82-like protein [Paraphysoderma sedebokerense]|nr:WD repeat-containing protein 82-like protein [Paraphysoderma sedebokerense]
MSTSQSDQFINPQTLLSMKTGRIFKDCSKRITSIDFDDVGELLVTASEDDSLRVYNCIEAKPHKISYSKKYGCHLARFTHKSSCIIYASTKVDHDLRYLSFHDNQYIRYFKGHNEQVVSLEMSPSDDHFISASIDGTLRLWDLRTPNCQGCIEFPRHARPSVTYDSSGQVFAFGLQDPLQPKSPRIRLYDVRKFDAGPFENELIMDSTSALPQFNTFASSSQPKSSAWTSLQFSNDGELLLVTTSGDAHYIVDGFKPRIKQKLSSHTPPQVPGVNYWGGEAAFTPDGKYVLAGSEGCITVYSTTDGNRVGDIDFYDCMSVQVVGFNPKKMMMAAVSDNTLAFYCSPSSSAA